VLIIGDESPFAHPSILPGKAAGFTLPLVGRVDEWMPRSGSRSAGWGVWRRP